MRVLLLADRERYCQPVLFGRQRAGGVSGVGAGRVLQAVEVEREMTGLVESVVGEIGVEEAGGSVAGGSAGGVNFVCGCLPRPSPSPGMERGQLGATDGQ